MTREMLRSKKKLIEVLGLVSCFWLCSAQGNLIIPKDMESQSEVQPESFESYQIRILRNQNQIQGEKIKVLREELLEATQKLHELKPHLFKQGNPADQERIADLVMQLGQKEEALNRISSTKRDMEQELSQARKKLSELDTIKDALTAMVEKHKIAKEQNAENYRTQIEELRAAADSEKRILKSKIKEHENNLERYKTAIGEKHKTIDRLDAITTAQEAALAQKEQELLSLENKALTLYDEILATGDAYGLIQNHKNNQISKLSLALETEHGKNKELSRFKEEIQWLSDLWMGTQAAMGREMETLRDQLEAERAITSELSIAKAQLEQKREELALLNAAHAEHAKGMEKITSDLQSELTQQQLRTEVLENQFLGILVHQEAAHHYAETLEGMVNELDELLAAKSQELETANAANSQATGNLLMQLEEAKDSLSQHKSYREALEFYLTLLETQNNVHDNAMDIYQQKMERGHQELYRTWQERLANIQELQARKEAELKQQLQETLAERDAHQSRADSTEQRMAQAADRSEKLLTEAAERVQSLNQDLESNRKLIAQKEKQLQELEAAQQAFYNDVDQRFKAIAAELDREQIHTAHLESLLENASNQIVGLEKQSVKNDADMEKLKISHVNAYMQWTDQIVNLQAALDEQQRKTEEFIHRTAYKIAETEKQLRSQLDDANTQLSQRNDEYVNLNLTHDYVTGKLSQKIASIEEELASERNRAKGLQEQIALALDQIELEQGHGYTHSQRAQQLSQELDEKMQLLALSKAQTSTTDYDNQELVRQNEQLLREITALEQKFAAEQDKVHTHSQLVDQLRNDLNESEQQLRTIAELQQHVQRLEETVASSKEQLEQERWGHQEAQHSSTATLEELEQYYIFNTQARERAIAELQEALRLERENGLKLREDLKLAYRNYHQEHSSLRNLEEITSSMETRSAILEDQLADARFALEESYDEVNLLKNSQNELIGQIASRHATASQEIDMERSARKNLQDQLDKALSLYENALHRNEDLEQVNGILNVEMQKSLALRDEIYNASQQNLQLQAQLEKMQKKGEANQGYLVENEREREENKEDNDQQENQGDEPSRFQKVNQIKSHSHQKRLGG